jgi:uncharacterized membrane protein
MSQKAVKWSIVAAQIINVLIFIPLQQSFSVFPETARWSLAHDRIDDAQTVLTKCGGKKNQTLDQDALRKLLEEIQNDEKQMRGAAANKRYTPLDLVRTPKLRKWTVIVCFNW